MTRAISGQPTPFAARVTDRGVGLLGDGVVIRPQGEDYLTTDTAAPEDGGRTPRRWNGRAASGPRGLRPCGLREGRNRRHERYRRTHTLSAAPRSVRGWSSMKRIGMAAFRGPPSQPWVTTGYLPSATSDRRRGRTERLLCVGRAGVRKASEEYLGVRCGTWPLDAVGSKKIPRTGRGTRRHVGSGGVGYLSARLRLDLFRLTCAMVFRFQLPCPHSVRTATGG